MTEGQGNDELEAAIDTVARDIIALSTEGYEPDPEDCPAIGEHDWLAIASRCGELAPYPPEEECAQAYKLLAARAAIKRLGRGQGQ